MCSMKIKRKRLLKKMFKTLIAYLGSDYDAGMMLAILCELFKKFTEGVDSRELRTLELILNDYFSVKYDFVNERVIQ